MRGFRFFALGMFLGCQPSAPLPTSPSKPESAVPTAGSHTSDSPAGSPADSPAESARVDGAPSESMPSKDCTNEAVCVERGECIAQGNRCVLGASKPEDCRKPRGDALFPVDFCSLEGACSVRDGNCVVASAADCKAALICRDEGRCSFDEANGRCFAASDEDCMGSTRCTEKHWCGAKDGFCIFSATSCPDSAWCKNFGACTDNTAPSADPDDRCVVSDDACRRSLIACKRDGYCTSAPTHTVSWGIGYAIRCVALSHKACRTSLNCKASGDCALVQAIGPLGRVPVCAPENAAHCQQSERCKRDGRCQFVSSADSPNSVAHCSK